MYLFVITHFHKYGQTIGLLKCKTLPEGGMDQNKVIKLLDLDFEEDNNESIEISEAIPFSEIKPYH